MCDTLCTIRPGHTLFAKNSDRPSGEPQVIEAFGPRPAGGTVRTQYLDIDDAGACAVVGSRPVWLWGFEHGVNAHRVAIGNEAVYTTGHSAEPALIGMDLVRLGLERGTTAEHAVETMTELLERYGQGGDCYDTGGSYDSSFLVADPNEAWVLETSGRTWTAKRFGEAAAISNRLTLRTDWDRASSDIEPGSDFDAYRDPDVDTGFADVRLEASRACVTGGARSMGPRDLARHLRDHGRPAGLPVPGSGDDEFSICMHVRGAMNTTAGIICDLPQDPTRPLRGWVALGSPCSSVFVPVFPPRYVPPELAEEKHWDRFVELRDRVEVDDAELERIRAVLAPLETELWAEADLAADDRAKRADFTASVWPRVEAALDRLA